MNFWDKFPLLRLIIPFMLGIISAYYFGIQTTFLFYFLLILVGVLAVFIFIKKAKLPYPKQWIFGMVLIISVFISGFQLIESFSKSSDNKYFERVIKKDDIVITKITSPISVKEKTIKSFAKIIAVGKPGQWCTCEGNIVISIQRDPSSEALKYGDLLLFNSTIKEINPAQNPDEFDYKEYLSYKNIFHQTYVDADHWDVLAENQGNPVVALSIEMRDKVFRIFKDNGITGSEFGLVAALILGYKDELADETIRAFSKTGTTHILAVSGMHVAIIFFVINSLLFFCDKFKYGNIIKAIIIIATLWFYAMMTGLSASVLRAVAMFTFVVIGKAFNRNINIYNMLAASAFVLLLMNPYNLFDVGFQLSYLAVIGIVAINPFILESIKVKNFVLRKIWELVSVSIAAQLAAFPLCMFYFHQFPNYFLLSNLVLIPISTVLIYMAIAVLVVSPIPVVSTLVGKATFHVILLMNNTAIFMEKIPYALIDSIYINRLQVILIYVFIAFTLLFIFYKRKTYFFTSLIALILTLSISLIYKAQSLQQKEFLVYSINKTPACNFIKNTKCVLISDSTIVNSETKYNFHISTNLIKLGVSEVFKFNRDELENKKNDLQHILWTKNKFIVFANKRFVLIDRDFKLSNSSHLVNIDYAIISGSPQINIKEILTALQINTIIFDSSNKLFKVKKWCNECVLLNQKFFAVPLQGSFLRKFE